jgi:uncharacterized membrane protein YeaQ/YmgE (transglycosylase-associated protein family)
MGFLAVDLVPAGGNILVWILVGLIAGAIASRLTRGRGLGCFMDIIVGLVGAFIGGLIVSPFLKPGTEVGFFGTTAVAIIGAVVLLLLIGLVRGRD